MSLARFFEQLGAPLTNAQWSWGAQRVSDGAVFLRVWEDETLVEDGRTHFLILGDSDKTSTSPRLGYRERLRHIDAVRGGAPCYLIVLIARDASALRRQIAGFDRNTVLVGGRIAERDGRVWIQVIGRRAVEEVTSAASGATR